MKMKFPRERLYKEIWQISARQVADKYGLNYADLLKNVKKITFIYLMVIIGITRIID